MYRRTGTDAGPYRTAGRFSLDKLVVKVRESLRRVL
jgi:hypothetical protein